MGVAWLWSLRATCPRLQVGAVVADPDLTTILAVGYNGQARGASHSCAVDQPGACGCLHAEENCLIKAPYDRGPLVMVTTHSPCVMCAKRIRNSAVTRVLYAVPYRSDAGLVELRSGGILVEPCPMTIADLATMGGGMPADAMLHLP